MQALEGCCRDAVPIVIVMKAMGIESDQEVTQLIGNEGIYTGLFAPSLQECKQQSIFTQQQALEWLGGSAQTSMHPYIHSCTHCCKHLHIPSFPRSFTCSLAHSLTHWLTRIHLLSCSCLEETLPHDHVQNIQLSAGSCVHCRITLAGCILFCYI